MVMTYLGVFKHVQTTSYPILVRLIPIIDGIVPMKDHHFTDFSRQTPKSYQVGYLNPMNSH